MSTISLKNKHVMKRFLRLPTLLLLVFLLSCARKEEPLIPKPQPSEGTPVNIILMIGDGMGLAQVSALRTAKHGDINIFRCATSGFQATQCADRYVTDSGASGTAMSTGEKTNYYYVGVDPEGNPLETILETAEKKGLMTGLVTTSSIDHATPATFYAHTTDRFQYEDIALDLLHSGVDFFSGGGRKFFDNRSDSLNLIDSLVARGYQVVGQPEEAVPGQGKIAVFYAENHPPSIPEGRGPVLKNSVVKALEHLKQSEKGFFMMIEGAQIDWAGEENDPDYLLAEMADFDDAVGVVLDFAQTEGNTLVIITGDHETGGLALTDGDMVAGTIEAGFVSQTHTGIMVPVWAYGPGAGYFAGSYENTGIYERMIFQFGWVVGIEE